MKYAKEPIAIVGVSSLFPEAENVQIFWNNIVYGVDAISDVPNSHWNIEDYYDPNPEAEDKTYCKRGGFMPRTKFSPVEFGIPPNALDVIDVLQLLSLNVAKSALHDAGYFGRPSYEEIKERTGVVLGITGANSLTQPLSNRLQSPKLRQVLSSRGLNEEQIADIVESLKKSYAPWEENSFPGMLGNVVAGRIANRFDMGGINCTIDAACASSLAAMRMAIDELHCGRADMMLTGGCDAENTILMFMCFSKTPAFSRRGIISPFDESSDGTLIGEGMGILALKRLSDAERDGDRIYALIKGLGASSDGKFKSIYAPRKEGQIKCLGRAYEDAGFDINKVGLIEAHGTGTMVGDATEVSALKEALGEESSGRIALGSVKSQIGHTKAAAGAAGLIKVAMSLHHKILPPTLNIKKPTEVLRDQNSPLYVNNKARPWFLNYGSDKRRAGVSSFGFGGTNFHAVLEEYSGLGHHARRLHTVNQAVVLGADSLAELRSRLNTLANLNTVDDYPFDTIKGKSYRLGFTAGKLSELKEKAALALNNLDKHGDRTRWQHPKGIYFSAAQPGHRIAALFSGQGSQHVNMAQQSCMAYPDFMAMFEQADRELHAVSGEYVSDKVYPQPAYDDDTVRQQAMTLRRTEYAQPAIGMVSSAAFKTLTQAGLSIDCVAGHSFGELTALWAAKVISDEDYVHLAVARGQAMKPHKDQAEAGEMAAVSASGERVEKLLSASGIDSVYLCNFNTDKQTVIGGLANKIAEFKRVLESEELQVTSLPVSAAFHTPLVEHAQVEFAAAVDRISFRNAAIPLYRNRDGKATKVAKTLKNGLKRQLLEPVRFSDMVRQMRAEGVDTFIEFGPKNHVSNMVSQLCDGEDVNVISVDAGKGEESANHLNVALVQLAVAGIEVGSLKAFEPDYHDAPAKSGFAVELSGINYTSDARRNAWQQSLQHPADVWQVSADKSAPIALEATTSKTPVQSPSAELTHSTSDDGVSSRPSPSEDSDSMPANSEEFSIVAKSTPQTPPKSQVLADYSESPSAAQERLQMFGDLLNGNSDIHDKYLNQTKDNTHQVISLIEQLNHSYTADRRHFDDIAGLARQGLSIVEQGQENTALSHQGYLRSAVELASMAAGAPVTSLPTQNRPQRRPKPVLTAVDVPAPAATTQSARVAEQASAPAPASAAAPSVTSFDTEKSTDTEVEAPQTTPTRSPTTGIDRATLMSNLMSVVAEKTGYPADVLEPTMDIEADLGIDSIKRVEILGALQKTFAGNVHIEPQQAAELRTLEDLATVLASAAGSSAPPPSAARPASVQPSAAPRLSVEQVASVLLAAVSEKTGYPEDVLSIEMDMEADLGIDSIKRVEILGAVQKALPEMPTLQPEALAEVRTLQDIIDIAGQEVSRDLPSPSVSPALTAVPTAPPAAPPAAAPASDIDAQTVTATFLSIVAEKTGYPEDVLEMPMSLEADLGIDSIKRVEILGELQKRLALQDGLEPAALAELGTLGDIAEYIKSALTGAGKPAVAASAASAPPAIKRSADPDKIKTTLLDIVSDKTGYPRDVIELEMDLEADLGIDSIKRVEILGGLQTEFPDLPAPKPELAGELRNLQQILDFLANTGEAETLDAEGSISAEGSSISAEGSITEPPSPAELSSIHQHAVELKKVRPVDARIDCYQAGARVLLVGEDKARTNALVNALAGAGFLVHVLVLPNQAQHFDGQQVRLADWQEETLSTTLNGLPPIDVVLAQFPRSPSPISKIDADSEGVQALRLQLLLAKHYKLALDKPDAHRRAFITLASIDGQLGLGDPAQHFLAAGSFGLVKTLAMETEHLFCRAIDAHPDLAPDTLAQGVVQELHDHNVNLTDIGLTAEDRYTFGVAVNAPSQEAEPLPERTCFIVTGGARGITASCVQNLARQQSGRYLLLGRTPLADREPEWAHAIETQSLKAAAASHLKAGEEKVTPKAINSLVNQVTGWREINDTLQALKDAKVAVRYVSLDITDRAAVSRWASEDPWLADSSALALIHGAGALADKRIEDKQAQDLERVFSVKLYGLANLLAALDDKKLIFSALFSSVAGLFGNVGQVDYAMANEILNRMTVNLNRPNHRSTSMIWGAWNAGMVTPDIKKMFESRGISLIEVGEGVEHFSDLCLHRPVTPLTMVGPSGGLSARTTSFDSLRNVSGKVVLNTLKLRQSALLKDHTIGGEVVLPATFAMGWVANVVENMFGDALIAGCKRMRVNKGMVLNDDAPDQVLLELKADGLNEQGQLVLDAVIKNRSTGQAYYSFQGMRLSHHLTIGEKSTIALDLSEEDAVELYRDKTLFHGDDFQLLKTYQQNGGDEILFTCRWQPENDHHKMIDNCYTKAFCPMYADALLQAALVWVKKHEGLPSLPMMIEDLRCHEPVSLGETLYIRVTLVDKSDSQSVLYLSALTKQGRVNLAMRAAVVKSAALSEKFSNE